MGLFLGAGIHVIAQECVEYGGDGDAEQHAAEAEQTTAHGDCCEHPQTGDADGGANHTGVDQVTLQLLEDDNENEEPDSLHGVNHNEQQTGECRAEVSACDGDQSGDGNDDGDQRGVLEAEYEHAQEAECTEDTGFGDLTDNETGEGVGGHTADTQGVAGDAVGEIGHNKLAALCAQTRASGQQVDGEDDGEEQVDHEGDHLSGGTHQLGNGSGDLVEGLVEELLQGGGEAGKINIFQHFEVEGGDHPVVEGFQVTQIGGQVSDEGGDAVGQLRDNEGDQ